MRNLPRLGHYGKGLRDPACLVAMRSQDAQVVHVVKDARERESIVSIIQNQTVLEKSEVCL